MILLLVNESIEVNSVDPDQNYLTGSTLSKRLLKHFSRRQKQTKFAVIDALRAKSIFLMYSNCIESNRDSIQHLIFQVQGQTRLKSACSAVKTCLLMKIILQLRKPLFYLNSKELRS